MEHIPEQTESVSGEEVLADRSFTDGAKKVERIAQQSKGLFDDIKEWVDLRIKLVKLEVEDELNARKKDAIVGTIMGGLGLLGIVFALITAALGLGAWLGHPAWGFLAVTGLLLMGASLLWMGHFARKKKKTPEGKKELKEKEERKQLPAGTTDT
ncbi:MAG: phage holin family protein [Rhodothermales bacterium]